MSWLIDQSLRRLKKGDFSGVCNTIAWSLSERYYERLYNISSSAPVPVSELGIDSSVSEQYDPTSYLTLGTIFRQLWSLHRNNNHGFLDVGCGKGRVTRVAATHPYQHVLGIDLSPELARIARNNLEQGRRKMVCNQVRIEVADAATFVIPDTVGTIFMYNPFRGVTMDRFMQNVLESFERLRREITVVLVNPTNFMPQQYPWIKATHTFSSFYPHYDHGMQVNLYTVAPTELKLSVNKT